MEGGRGGEGRREVREGKREGGGKERRGGEEGKGVGKGRGGRE